MFISLNPIDICDWVSQCDHWEAFPNKDYKMLYNREIIYTYGQIIQVYLSSTELCLEMRVTWNMTHFDYFYPKFVANW